MIELKEIDIENRTCYYLEETIKIKDFDINNFLIDQKPYRSTLVYNISQKSLIDLNILCIRFDKQIDLLEFIIELDIEYYLDMENMITFTSGLDMSLQCKKWHCRYDLS